MPQKPTSYEVIKPFKSQGVCYRRGDIIKFMLVGAKAVDLSYGRIVIRATTLERYFKRM